MALCIYRISLPVDNSTIALCLFWVNCQWPVDLNSSVWHFDLSRLWFCSQFTVSSVANQVFRPVCWHSALSPAKTYFLLRFPYCPLSTVKLESKSKWSHHSKWGILFVASLQTVLLSLVVNHYYIICASCLLLCISQSSVDCVF